MKSARVQDFHTILIGLLTQYDQKESLRELKRGGRSNIYRLGHYLKAAEDAERAAKAVGIWNRDEPIAIAAYTEILMHHFIWVARDKEFALSPLRQLRKRMKAWVEQGKLPMYGTAKRDNPAWTKVFG